MFSLFTRPARPHVAPARRPQLFLEALEARDGPSALTFDNGGLAGGAGTDNGFLEQSVLLTYQNHAPATNVSLNVAHGQGTDVVLTGTVGASDAAGLTVAFQGVVRGTAVTDANGRYGVTLPAAQLGTVLAAVVGGGDNVLSNVAAAEVASAPPRIVNFTSSVDATAFVTFTGRVVADNPQGLTVSFGGVPDAVQNKSTRVNADGTFSLGVAMSGTERDNGNVDARINADWWGQPSNVAVTYVNQIIVRG